LLLVEDDPELIAALQTLLAREYDVSAATDIPGASELLRAHRYDLLILDLILPKGTGLEILARLAQNPDEAPPVLVMSALGREVDLSPFQAILAGSLTKPFGIDEVGRRVREALAGRRQEAVTAQTAAGHVLLVDDDPDLLLAMAESLTRCGYTVRPAGETGEAVMALGQERFDAVVTDWIMPGITGMDLMKKVKQMHPDLPVLLLTGYATPDMLRHACQAGAADVLVKPFPLLALPVALEKCLVAPKPAPPPPVPERPQGRSGPAAGRRYTAERIIGDSPAMQRARLALSRVAALDSSVLILGETGTGKELFAQAVHGQSGRADGPFVALNAAAIPESLLESELFGYAAGAFTGARKEGQKGKFLQAHGGTLFLDEIGDLPLPLQVKLLRVLQEGEVDMVGGGSKRVDVRIVAATHRDLEAMVARGEFRSDLYYRLNVVTLQLPPLRERLGDIPQLAERFLSELRTRYGRPAVRLSGDVMEVLARHTWPGNIRELRNVVERAFAFATGDLMLPADLPPGLLEEKAAPAPAPAARVPDLASQERETILRALESTGGNKLQAAKLLGISRANLYVKIKVYGIS
jgi:DNA-binding NtrC family response regulator